MQQIADQINTDLATQTVQVRAKINDHYALELYTLNTGSAAYVEVTNMSAGGSLTNVLGVANGRYSGTGGNPGVAKAYDTITLFDFSQIGATDMQFTVNDHHDSAASMTTINLNKDYSAGGLQSVVDDINLQIGANGLLVEAEINNGTLQLRSLETGVESNFTITDLGAGQPISGGLKLHPQTTISGFDGNPADQNFAYDQASSKWGYTILSSAATATVVDNLSFFIADLDGNGMTITVSAGETGNSFRPIVDIANQINAKASSEGVKVNAEINTANQTLRLYSTIPGKEGKVVMTELGSPDSTNTLRSVWNVEPKAYENGVGNYAYTMHVKDTSIQFQIGPNQGHTAVSNIIRTDVKALGIEDLDLTTAKSSEIAIGLIDKALQMISSERAKLGAIENRMTYTQNSLRVALQNMTASESRIRDVDMASEVIKMTSAQILQQSSNAMVGQANASAQNVLSLLQ
jgi:flagellin-like hook-associated protein FlgL